MRKLFCIYHASLCAYIYIKYLKTHIHLLLSLMLFYAINIVIKAFYKAVEIKILEIN